MFSEISWGANYPEELPTISLESFYNKHLLLDVKSHIIGAVKGGYLLCFNFIDI